MTTGSERNAKEESPFSAVLLAGGFLNDAWKLGLTPMDLQCLRENSAQMKKFVAVAKEATREHNQRVVARQIERERSIDIHGKHHHLVLVLLRELECTTENTFAELLERARRDGFVELSPLAYVAAGALTATAKGAGLWLAGERPTTKAFGWEQDCEMVSLLRLNASLDTKLGAFPRLRGFVFMQEAPDCELRPR